MSEQLDFFSDPSDSQQKTPQQHIAEMKELLSPENIEARRIEQERLDKRNELNIKLANERRQRDIERAREQGIDIRTPEEIQNSINERGIERIRRTLRENRENSQ